MIVQKGAARSAYQKLEPERQPFLDRGRDCAKLTVPSLLPPEGWPAGQRLPVPWQSLGARGLRNLASRLLLSLFPPNAPFFRFRIDEATLAEIAGSPAAKVEIEESLASMERVVMDEIEVRHVRISAFEALKQLLLSGNTVMFLPTGEDTPPKVFDISKFVCKRDGEGKLQALIVREIVSRSMLPPKVAALLPREQFEGDAGDMPNTPEDVELYTVVQRSGKRWVTWQEVENIFIPSSFAGYTDERMPWLVLRFSRLDGEDYGRGYTEELLGDLKSLNGLRQAVVEGSAAASRILMMVNPSGTTRAKDLESAPNGAVINGNAEDVTTLQVEKRADMAVAQTTVQDLVEALSYAFLLNSAVQRNAERVTAEEIRYMAAELEHALGGAYSVMALEFQLPLVRVLSAALQAKGKLPKLKKNVVRPSIVTGLEALGRGHDFTRLNTALTAIANTLGPEAIQANGNSREIMLAIFNATGLEAGKFVKTAEQIQQEQQQAQQQAMLEQFGNQAVDIAANAAQGAV